MLKAEDLKQDNVNLLIDEASEYWHSQKMLCYQTNLLSSSSEVFRYIFTSKFNNEKGDFYYKQLSILSKLSNILERSVCFIYNDCFSQNFVFGLIIDRKILIIDPTSHSNEYLIKLKEGGVITHIYKSSAQMLQEPSLSFSAAICMKLMYHISKLSMLDILVFIKQLPNEGNIDITPLLPFKLQVLINQNEDYTNKLIDLRKKYIERSAILSDLTEKNRNSILNSYMNNSQQMLMLDLISSVLNIGNFISEVPQTIKNNIAYTAFWLKPNFVQAIKNNNIHQVQKILHQSPELLNSINLQGYTPLRLAIASNSLEVVKLLLNRNASLGMGSLEINEFSISVAKPDLAQFIDCCKNKYILQQKLKEAYLDKNYPLQCNTILELAKWHLSQQEYSSAAKLLNGALAIAKKYNNEHSNHPINKIELIKELKKIEPLFIKEQLKIEYKQEVKAHGINPQHKQHLKALRVEVKERLKEFKALNTLPDEETVNKIEEVFKYITQAIKLLLANIIQDCVKLMPNPPPCDYDLIGVGSLAREEMTPYSDLECFILISEDSEEHKRYFRVLSQLFELKIINLGETDLVKGQNLLPDKMLNPVPKGLSLDLHKNPNKVEYDLIGTPTQIASYQLPEKYITEPDNHLSPALINVIGIYGNFKLLQSYKEQVHNIHQNIRENGQTLAKHRALQNLKQDIKHYQPKIEYQDNGRLFIVKEDFYRLPQTSIETLLLYFNVDSKNPIENIDNLCKNGIISDKAVINIKRVLSAANLWRLTTYSYYGTQKDFIDILHRLGITTTSKEDYSFYNVSIGVTNNEEIILIEAYKTLLPLWEGMVKFYYSNGQEVAFALDDLYDTSYLASAIIYARLCKYKEAKNFCEQGLQQINILDSDKSALHTLLGIILLSLRQTKESISSLKQALNISNSIYKNKYSLLMEDYNNLGAALSQLGNIEKAHRYHRLALNTWIDLYGCYNIDIAGSYNNLGLDWYYLGDAKKAIVYYKTALAIQLKICGNLHPVVAGSYANLGNAWHHLGKAKKALSCFKQALRIKHKIYSAQNLSIAQTYNSLGLVWNVIGNMYKAFFYYNLSLEIKIKYYGDIHPEVANDYDRLGLSCINLKKYEQGLKYLNLSFHIRKETYGSEHLSVANSYNNMGSVYGILGDFEKARKCYYKALTILLKIYNEEHPMIALNYYNLGLVWEKLGDIKKAICYHQKALTIRIEIYGFKDSLVADSYYELGRNLTLSGKLKEALKCLKGNLEVKRSIYGDNHPNLISCYCNIGNVYVSQGKIKKVAASFANAAKILIQLPESPSESIEAVKEGLAAALLTLINVYYARNCLDEAVKEYEKIIEIFPKEWQLPLYNQVYHNFACFYHVRGLRDNCDEDYQLADKYFNLAIVSEAKANTYCEYGQFLYHRGLIEDSKEKLYSAARCLKEAIKLNEKDSKLYYGLLEKDTVILILQKYIENEPIIVSTKLLAYYLLIQCYIKLQQEEKVHKLSLTFKDLPSVDNSKLELELFAELQEIFMSISTKSYVDIKEVVSPLLLYQHQQKFNTPYMVRAVTQENVAPSSSSSSDVEVKHYRYGVF